MKVAILDDYQRVALRFADWAKVLDQAEVTVFDEHIADQDRLVEQVDDCDAVVLMRERTPFPASVIERLGRLRLIVTTGRRNAAIDLDAARSRGVVVSGTDSLVNPPAELTWALILGLKRHLLTEATAMRTGGWQSTVGGGLAGSTLGVLGLGRIGSAVAAVGRAFGMNVVAWSPHLTSERAAEQGARAMTLDELLFNSDVVTVHLVLGDQSRGLLGQRELGLMRPGAILVNTSRAPIVDTGALLEALQEGRLGGAGLDVFDQEPLAHDHPLRSAPNTLLTPHLGYVTDDVYRLFYRQVVEDIVAFLDGEPIRLLT